MDYISLVLIDVGSRTLRFPCHRHPWDLLADMDVVSGDRRRCTREQPGRFATPVDDIAPGEVRFQIDLYKPREVPDSRHLLFMRKGDGSLRAWYFHVIQQQPLAPDGDDWSVPGKACEPFALDPDKETIQCSVNDREHNRQLVLRWTWDGKSLGQIAPALEPVAGQEEDGNFVFGADALDPALRGTGKNTTADDATR